MVNQKVARAIMDALEATIFSVPTDHGLFAEELDDALAKVGFEKGEIHDEIIQLARSDWVRANEAGKYSLVPEVSPQFDLNSGRVEGYPAPSKIMDFIPRYLREQMRKLGREAYGQERSVLVARCISEGFTERDVEVAITLLLFHRTLIVESKRVKINAGREDHASYSEVIARQTATLQRPVFFKLLPVVQDIIARRTDGRERSTDPLVALEDKLVAVGRSNFKVWWYTTRNELATLEPSIQPKSFFVLAAALCEGALTLIATKAKGTGLSFPQDLPQDPRNWKFAEHLILGASQGSDPIIKDPLLKDGLLKLNKLRQQIHAGALLADYSSAAQVPDIRQEEARFAADNLLKLARSIVEWVRNHNI